MRMECLGCDERGAKEVSESSTGFKPIPHSSYILSFRVTHAERGHLRGSRFDTYNA